MATKRKTNVELITYLMNYSKHGALMQGFIIDALGKHANKVAESTPADYPEDCMVSPEAWIGVAKELKEALDLHLGS